jgi:hypothetical protein
VLLSDARQQDCYGRLRNDFTILLRSRLIGFVHLLRVV